MTKLTTVLHSWHSQAGARMVDFAGWDMPVQYQGIAAEHRVVRTTCGAFDLGHMGRLHVSGDGALAFLERQVTRPLASMAAGRVRYGLVCAEDGTVEDDVLVSRESETAFHIVVNASNHGKILALWQAEIPDDVTLTDLSQQQAMIAVQGPEAAALLAGLGLDPGDCKYYQFIDGTFTGEPVRLSRTGYTGEDGFELFGANDVIAALWQAVIDAGATPCGLGARDTLRLEAGMPLYGHELDREHTPIEAGLGFAVAKHDRFRGAAALHAQRDNGTARQLVGLVLEGRRPARAGYPVVHADQAVGEVTSGAPSPTLEQSIAMAYVPSELAAVGTSLAIDIRGKHIPATVVELPFYRRTKG